MYGVGSMRASGIYLDDYEVEVDCENTLYDEATDTETLCRWSGDAVVIKDEGDIEGTWECPRCGSESIYSFSPDPDEAWNRSQEWDW